jgi:hypothetical protein
MRMGPRDSSARGMRGKRMVCRNGGMKTRQLVRALGTAALLSGFIACAAPSAYADGSVSSLPMGMGAPNAYAFAQFQSVIQQYNAVGRALSH